MRGGLALESARGPDGGVPKLGGGMAAGGGRGGGGKWPILGSGVDGAVQAKGRATPGGRKGGHDIREERREEGRDEEQTGGKWEEKEGLQPWKWDMCLFGGKEEEGSEEVTIG